MKSLWQDLVPVFKDLHSDGDPCTKEGGGGILSERWTRHNVMETIARVLDLMMCVMSQLFTFYCGIYLTVI